MEKETKSSGDKRLESIETSLNKSEVFIEKNKKIITYVLSGVILVVLAIWGYNRFIKQPKIESAEEDMYMAEMYYEMDSLNLALNGDGEHIGFLDVVDQYSGTPSANLAHYYMGMIYLKQGAFEESIEELKKFDGDDDIIGPMAVGCIGDAYLELNNTEEALKYYEKAAEKSNNNFTTPMYLMRAAWVNEMLNQWDKALVKYEKIKKEYTRSFEAREIDKYIEQATIKAGK